MNRLSPNRRSSIVRHAVLRAACAFACTCILGVSPGRSQHLRFDHISTEQGLSQDIVTSIVQDGQGFMWFGTEDGLNRFDGYAMRTYKYDPGDSSSICGDWITVLCADRQGRIWVGTGVGAALYDQEHDRFIRINHRHSSSPAARAEWITGIGQDSTGAILMTTGDGLHRLNEQTGTLIEPETDRSTIEGLNGVFTDRHGTVWVGSQTGICVVDPSTGRINRFHVEGEGARGIIGGITTGFAEDFQGNLWIASGDSGLTRLNPTRTDARRFRRNGIAERSLSSDIVHSVCFDKRGILWIGTFLGLDRYDLRTENVDHFHSDPADPSSLSAQRIYRVFADRAGALWVGTYQGGVNRYDPLKQRFLHYRNLPGIAGSGSNDESYSLLETRNGALWVGTAAGLVRFDRGTGRFHLILESRKIHCGAVTALRERTDGTLWVGTEIGELLQITPRGTILRTFLRSSDYRARAGLSTIRALHETEDGYLWIGTAETGLMRLNTRGWNLDMNPLSSTGATYGLGVWVIHEDRQRDLWFGGWAGATSLLHYNPRTRAVRQYTSNPGHTGSISNPAVRTIFEDTSGVLWIGTWSGGLNRYDRTSDSFATITERDGLSNNYVKGILADARGRLWISTERGLTRYDPREGTFKRYTTEDGLQADRFLSGSCCAGRDGWMYFGGENGFNGFHPDSVYDNTFVPPVVVTSFRIFDHPMPFLERTGETPVVHLGFNQDFISFEFVALNFTQPQHNQYAYIMEGFDRDWIQSGTRRYAAYTHLGGGTYIFRVRGANNDGVWNNVGASVLVIIDPPFWLTWWFLALVVAFGSMGLYLLYRYRVRQLLQVERLRTRIASDLHDELASNLTSIAMFSKIVQDALQGGGVLPGGHHQLLERITILSQESVSSIRDIIWTIDPRTETLGSLLQRLYDSTIPECNARGIVFRYRRPPDNQLPPHNLPPEQRRHLWLILKETLHNAIKHSGCSAITLSTTYEAPHLLVSVRDDGTGFDPSSATSGKGLGTLRMRAEQLSGTLTITSTRSAGTTVDLRCIL